MHSTWIFDIYEHLATGVTYIISAKLTQDYLRDTHGSRDHALHSFLKLLLLEKENHIYHYTEV